MKMTRKLIPALVMLLVSAVMLSTASFAWFASNDTVAVNDMHVKVKSTAKFLEISKTSSTAGFGKSVDISNTLGDGSGYIELIHANVTEDADSASLEWQTGSSDSYTEVGSVTGTIAVSTQYALMNTLYVRMSPTSTADLTNLRIKTGSITVKDTEGNTPTDLLAPALRLLIVCKDDESNVLGMQLWSNRDGSITTYNGTDDANVYIAPNVVLGEVYTVETYLFFDGEDASATTANTTGLQELVVGFSLTAGPEVGTP